MSKVRVINTNIEYEIRENESLLDCLRRNGVQIRSSCGGHASCKDCLIRVEGGDKSISKVTFEEKKLLGNVFFITKERLACQTKVTDKDSVAIEVINLD